MKKYIKYLGWIPFCVSIGALILYLKYTIMFKLDSNLVMTDQVKETLNQYLIVLFISLFIGLGIVLFKKILLLVHSSNYNENMPNQKPNYASVHYENENIDDKFKSTIKNNEMIYNKVESNFIKDIKNNRVIKVRLSEPIIGNTIKAKVIDTDEDIEILLLDDDIDYMNNINKSNNMNNLDEYIKCPKCGNKLDKDAIICTNCGILINKDILFEISGNKQNEVKYDNNIVVTNIPKQNKYVSFLFNFIIILLCIFLIFLIGNKIINQSGENYSRANITQK